MARGLVQGITRGTPVYPLPDAFLSVGQNNLNLIGLAIPWVVVIALLLSIVAALILKYTTYGRKLYAAGGNGEAARLAGIPTSRLRFGAFVLTGVLAALTGVLMASRLGSAQSAVGNGFEMIVIAGAVIGGISMRGQIGVEVEPFEMLEMVQLSQKLDEEKVADGVQYVRSHWKFERPCEDSLIETGVRYALAVGQKIRERGWEAVSLIDVDGMAIKRFGTLIACTVQ